MAATELLCNLFCINPQNLSRQENLILEVELFWRVYEELLEFFLARDKDYFSLINLSFYKESAVLEAKFLRYVINDILMTEEYSLEGIAYYTQIPEDMLCDIASGANTLPSLYVSRKIIELHRSVRPDLYKEVVKKITIDYLAAT